MNWQNKNNIRKQREREKGEDHETKEIPTHEAVCLPPEAHPI
jgi:hypothetical protein